MGGQFSGTDLLDEHMCPLWRIWRRLDDRMVAWWNADPLGMLWPSIA
jgi:hypothetical protein